MGFWMPELGLAAATTVVLIAFIGDEVTSCVGGLCAGALTILAVVRFFNQWN